MGKRVKAGLVKIVAGGRVVKLVSEEHALKLLENDKAEAVTYRSVFALQLVAGRVEQAELRTAELGAAKAAQVSACADGRASCTVMTQFEVEAVAGDHGKSKTLGLPADSWVRDQRVANRMKDMDPIEQAVRKFLGFTPRERVAGMQAA